MLNLGTAFASIDVRLDRLEQNLAKAEREFASTGKRIDQQAKKLSTDISNSMSSLGRTLSLAVTAPLVALGIASVKAATDMDSLKRGLTAVAGSSKEAERQMVRLREVAKLPGLGFREAIEGATRLQAAGFSANMAERALRGFGNALATVGKGKAELDGVILALGQIEAKGKVSAEEINQIAERVPQIRQIMKDAFGTADTEVLQKAKISTKEFFEAIISNLERLPQVTGGAKNSFENFQDSANRALTAIGNNLLPMVTKALDKVAPILEDMAKRFNDLPDAAKSAFGGLALGGAIIGPALIGLASLASAIKDINNLLKGSILARLLGGGTGAAVVAGGAAAYLGYKVLSTGVTEEQAARAMRREREEYLANARRQGPEALRKAEARVNQLYPIGPARVSGMGAVRAVEGAQVGRIPENERPGFIDAAARAAAAARSKDAAEEAKRLAERRREALKQYEIDMARFRDKWGGERKEAERHFQEQIPLIGKERASNELRARLKQIDADQEKERQASIEARKRTVAGVNAEWNQLERNALNERLENAERNSEEERKRRAEIIDRSREQALNALKAAEFLQKQREELLRRGAPDVQDWIADPLHMPRGADIGVGNREIGAPGLTGQVGDILAQRDPVGFQRRIERIQDQLRQSFGGILGQELSFAFVDSFAAGLEKAFGRSSIGRAFSRAITRWLDTFMAGVLDRTIGGIAGKIASGVGGGGLFSGVPLLGDIGKLLGFDKGGIVPGPIGQPRLAVVHGGEEVRTPGQAGGIIVNMGGVVIGSDYDVDRMMDRVYWAAKNRMAVNAGTF